MATVPQLWLRPSRGTLPDLLRRAPRLLRRLDVPVLHLALEGLAELAGSAGLRAAEEVRRTACARVRDAAGARALVALSGDAVVVVAPRDPEAAVAAARTPCVVPGGHVVTPVVRAGVARSRPGVDVAALLDDAATAGRAAARACSDALVPADELLRAAARERLRLQDLVRRAVPEGRLQVHYQPLVDLRTGSVTGAEALVRLLDDDGTLVAPSSFVPLAEESGAVVALGTAVLRTAARQAAAWRTASPDLAVVAVNVSACQVAQPDFADVVLAALEDADLPACALVLELTETVLLGAGPTALQQLHRLRAHGVRTGVDDFGTGYASLTYLRTLPLAFLKLDRSFVSGLPSSEEDVAVVRAVLRLADDLGLECIAEGVETPAQLALLQALGAVNGQGYLLSRPLPAEQFRALLAEGVVAALPRPRAVAP